jgi:hypothetical protein
VAAGVLRPAVQPPAAGEGPGARRPLPYILGFTFLPVQQNATITEVGGKALPDYMVKALGLPEVVKGAVPYQETPKADEQRAWDAAAARQRLHEWAGGDWKKYRQGFAYVRGDGSKGADYLLPHHDVVGGELKVVWNGVKAALAALHGARADMELSDADAKAVHHHLARHYEQFGRTPPDVRMLEVPAVAFTPYAEVERSIARRIAAFDFAALAEQAVRDALDRARGRV